MPFSQGSRAGLSYVPEVTFGVTPGTPSLVALPYTSHTLNLAKERVTGNDLQIDRMTRVDRHGNRSVAGDFVADLRKADYDPFLEAAFFNTFSANVLKIGTTPKFFSVEDAATDISQFRLFTGVSVSTLAVSIKPNQMVTGTFGLVGKDMTVAGTSIDAIKTAASTNQPFDSYSGLMEIGNSGVAPTASAIITGIDFTISNELAPTYVIGSPSTPQLEYGMAMVEGTITAYFENAALINRFINEVQTGIRVSVDDPTGVSDYTFFFPRVKINAADIPVDGPTSRIITMPFVALYDTVENTSVSLTRSV